MLVLYLWEFVNSLSSESFCYSSFCCVVYCLHFQSPTTVALAIHYGLRRGTQPYSFRALCNLYLNCFVSSFIRHNVGPWSLYFSPTHTKFHKKIDSLYFTLFKYSLHIGEPTMTEPWLVKMGDVMSIYTLYWLHCPVGSAVRQYQTWVKCTPSLFRGGVLLTLWKYPF